MANAKNMGDKMIKNKANHNNEQIERMKILSLNDVYFCNGEMYKLLCGKFLPNLITNLQNEELKISNDLVYGKSIITKAEKFLENLDKYIGYIRNNYLINYTELSMIIEVSLNNKYSKILFSQEDYYQNENYNIYTNQYRKMFLFNFYDNICFYSKIVSKESSINKFLQEIKQYNFDDEKDIVEIEKIFIKIINNRKYDLYNAFVPYRLVNENNYEFYSFQIEWIISDYYENIFD